MTLTYRFRLKDKHAAELNRQARAGDAGSRSLSMMRSSHSRSSLVSGKERGTAAGTEADTQPGVQPAPSHKPMSDDEIFSDPDLSIDPDCVGYEDENWEHRTHFGRP